MSGEFFSGEILSDKVVPRLFFLETKGPVSSRADLMRTGSDRYRRQWNVQVQSLRGWGDLFEDNIFKRWEGGVYSRRVFIKISQ